MRAKAFPSAVLLTFALVFSCVEGWSQSASVYYVATTGSDSTGNGSAAHPWATIGHADAVCFQLGVACIVHVAAGDYQGSILTEAHNITFISDTRWGAKLVGTDLGQGSTWRSTGSSVTITGFNVSGPSMNVGIALYGSSTTVSRNNVHDIATEVACTSSVGGAGILVNPSGQRARIDANNVHGIGPTPCSNIQGIYFAGASYGRASNNIVFDNSGAGILVWHCYASSNVIANNTVFNNHFSGIVMGCNSGECTSSTAGQSNVFVNNISYRNGGYGIAEEYPSTVQVHNTFMNNLVYRNSQNGPCTLSNCNFVSQNQDSDVGEVNADPLLVRYTGKPDGFYALTSGSPAVNTGTSFDAPSADYIGISRPQGCCWDIGAYEFVGP